MERRNIDGRTRLRLALATGAIAIGAACSSATQALAEAQDLHRMGEMTQRQIEEGNARTVRRLCEECIQGGRLEILPELVSADYRDGAQGPEALERRIDALRAGIPDLRFTVEELFASGDRVVVRWTWSGTHAGTLAGFAPTHRSVTVDGITIYQLRDGLIVRDWLQSDRLGFLRQIGAVPEAPGAAPAAPAELGDVRYVRVAIRRAPGEVYEYASKPENLPAWAAGLSGSIRRVDGEWVAESPMGTIRVRMAPRNEFGVLDHVVVLESGEEFLNPMRVVPREGGSEVVFTLFRRPDQSDAQLAQDAGLVQRDLQALRDLLEGTPAGEKREGAANL